MSDAFFLDDQSFFAQMQIASEPDPSIEPDFHLMSKGEVYPPRQLLDGHTPASQPLVIPLFGRAVAEVQFALEVHQLCRADTDSAKSGSSKGILSLCGKTRQGCGDALHDAEQGGLEG